uniref:Threonine dehydrogenase n=1 Tax=Candidatus Kentrum sp. LFY TaxID=2126342 RepID=A0A450WPV6_9GAMM|nr:MAG: Threonine dehydrogenase [Candidatus Kentron sp. LFY]VFK19093.1 MAG: Threonine dehydrogenase [Candidatus Kentron sp. LFY]
MKAYVIDNKQHTVNLKQVEKPTIKNGELLLKNLKWSICRTDVSQVRNELGEDASGKVPGHEILARIEESRDPRFDAGDYVVYMGATDFGGGAEYKAIRFVLPNDPIRGKEFSVTDWFWTTRNFYDVPGAAVIKINPANSKLRRYGSLLEPLCCVLRALEKYPPNAGDNAIILGAGCIGMLALQCMKKLYGVDRVAILDIDEKKLQRVNDVYKEYGESIETFCIKEPSEEQRTTLLPDLKQHPKKLIDYPLEHYTALLGEQNKELDDLIQKTKGAFGNYLFEALPPLPEDQQFPHTRFLGADLLAPNSRYVHFSADAIEEKTKFFWPLLAKGLTLHSAGFDQRCYPMPRTALVLQKACAYVEADIISPEKLVTSEIHFDDERAVQKAFSDYGTGEHMWKTVVTISDSDG